MNRRLETWFCHMYCGLLGFPFRSLHCDWQLHQKLRCRHPHACWMAAAAGSRVSVGHRVWSIFTLGRDFCFPAFVFSLTEENVAALMYHVVDNSHVLVDSSSDAGTDEGLDKHAAAALLNHGVDDSHDLVYSSSDVGTDEGLNRHVLAGSLFSGTGEQASGRVDVPPQGQAAARHSCNKFYLFLRQVTGWGVLCR